MGREYQAASSSHAVAGTLKGGTRRRRTHPLRTLVVAATAILAFQAGYVAPTAVAAATGTAGISATPAPDAAPPADETPVLDPADEVVTARTETTRTYDLGNGRYAVEAFADPLFYQPEGSTDWLPIDLDFVIADTGAVAAVTRAPVQVSVGTQADGLVALEYGDYRIALRPIPVTLDKTELAAAIAAPSTAGKPVPERHRVDLPDVLPGVGLRVFAHTYGTSNFLVFAERPAATSWTFAVSSPGLTLVAGRDGALDFVDGAGKAVAAMPAPYAVDSTPDERTGSGRTTTAAWYTLAGLDGQQLVTVSVDPAWLADAVFPVYVDPSVTVYNEGTSTNGDTHVNEGNPTFRYANYQRPDSPYYYEMWLGESPSDSSYFNMDFIQFALSAYEGTVVDDASVKIRPYHQYYDAPTASRAWLRRVTATWTENINWNEKPTATDTGMTSADCVEGEQCAFDVTAMAANWLDGDYLDAGVRIDEVDTSGNRKGPTFWKRLIASEEGTTTRPRLYFTYHAPVSVTSPDGGATATTADRTLSWATESGWGQDAYRVEVSTSSTFASTLVTSGDVTSSTAREWAIPAATSLTDGTTYYWRVKARRTTARATTMWSQYASGSFAWSPGANLGLAGHNTFESFDLGAGDNASVNVSTGNLVLAHPVVDLPIRGGSLPITLTYNSFDTADVGLGAGWRLNVQRRLTVNPTNGNVTFTDADGSRHMFTYVAGTFTAPKTIYATLAKTAGTPNNYTLTYRDRSVDVFHELAANTAFLKEAKDRFDNTVTFGYSGTTLASATDPVGRSVTFTWAADRLTIRDWAVVDANHAVLAAGTPNRTHQVFLAGGTVAGWADAYAPSATTACPSVSHAVCLGYAGGLLTSVGRYQTYTTSDAGSGSLGTANRTATTTIAYRGTEVASVQGAAQAAGDATTVRRPTAGQVVVVRKGTPALGTLDATTTYGLQATTDAYARVATVTRKLGTAGITRRTTWDPTYPIEPASVTDNDGGTPSRTVSYTYEASTLGRLATMTEPLDGTRSRITTYTYNTANDVTQTVVSSSGTPAWPSTTTRYTWGLPSGTCTPTPPALYLRVVIENYTDGTPDANHWNDQDVTTSYDYDCAGQRTRETRANHRADGSSLDQAATGWTYDTLGNRTAEIRNYVDGSVAPGGMDITPDTTSPTSLNVRTDLTTAYGYDTAGNQVSSADPRRGIDAAQSFALAADDYVTATAYDALNQATASRLPSTPTRLAAACSPSPACRTSSTEYDELGLARLASDVDGKVTATLSDAAGQATETYRDDDGTGGTAARIIGRSGYDAAGHLAWTEDELQVNDPAGGTDPGRLESAYDELGRTVSVTEAAGSASPSVASTTVTGYDALDRRTLETTGTESPDAQTTRWTYDPAGRVLDENDGFTCSTSTYDWRDQPVSIAEGRTGGTACSGTGTRTINQVFDALGRLTSRQVAGGAILETNTYDTAGRVLSNLASDGTTDRVTETTWNPLDEPITEHRFSQPAGGGTPTGETWSRANRDPAGNETDRCTWAAAPAEWCHNAGDTTWATPAPTTRVSALFDARNSRIKQYTPGVGSTTYDPDAGYQVKGVFLPTANGKEHQTLYAYDSRDRLDTITVLLCSTSQDPCPSVVPGSQRVVDDYAYDANDNRTSVAEDNGSGAVTTTYGYDARNQLVADSSGGTACPGGQAYAYDAAGNRTCAGGRTFGYGNGTGQLESCTGTSCAPVFDADGRLARVTTATGIWSYLYDGEGRLTSACNAASCTGTGFGRLDSVYDGEGHRVRFVETPASGTPTVTDFSYEGDRVVRETATTSAQLRTRTFTVDEAGAIVKMTVATTGGSTDDGTYLVVWSGHGDALELARIDPGSGTLASANRFTYGTWGIPTLQTVGTFGDLGFRYRYAGRFDVQWDSTTAVPAELLSMHARHYAPEFGRFLQPDPSAAEANLYAYAGNSPVTKLDPDGLATPMEKVICALTLGLQCFEAESWTKWAQHEAETVFKGRVFNDGKGDAYKHCCWSAALTWAFGARTAEILTNAHERWGGDEPSTIDYHNNAVGREVGRAVSQKERKARWAKTWLAQGCFDRLDPKDEARILASPAVVQKVSHVRIDLLPVRRLSSLVLMILVLTAAACNAAREDPALVAEVYDLASRHVDGDEFQLDAVLGDAWDRAFLMDGQPSSKTVDEVLGFHWPGYEGGMGDGTTIVVVRGSEVVTWAYLPSANGRTTGQYVEFEFPEVPWYEVTPQQGTFRVVNGGTDGPIQVCAVATCPDKGDRGHSARTPAQLSAGWRQTLDRSDAYTKWDLRQQRRDCDRSWAIAGIGLGDFG